MRCAARLIPLRPTPFRGTALLFSLLLVAGETSIQLRAETPRPRTSSPQPTEESPEVEEILRLRKLVGDPFRGTILESTGVTDEKSGAEQFAGALRDIARKQAATQETLDARNATDLIPPVGTRSRCEESYQDLLQKESWEPAVPTRRPLTGTIPAETEESWEGSHFIPGAAAPGPWIRHPLARATRVESAAAMRLVARRIGQTADDLEDLARYSEADELRQVANRLRQAARAEQEPPID